MNFPNIYVLPNIKAKNRDGSPDHDGLKRLGEILTRRVVKELFSGDSLTALASLSSGIPRELIALARIACLEARASGKDVIMPDHVEQAAKSRRLDYQVLLSNRQIELLRNIHQTKSIDNDEDHRALLHNLSALEFRNDEAWYDVHPLIEPLLIDKS